MFRFSIRELMLVTLVVAMGAGWWIDRSRLAHAAWRYQEALSQILLRKASKEEVAKVQRLFPEAQVVSGNWGAPSLGDPVYIGKRALPGPGDLGP
jgi:hypothetical protein